MKPHESIKSSREKKRKTKQEAFPHTHSEEEGNVEKKENGLAKEAARRAEGIRRPQGI
jgi:hypothetical protein